jgi:hypothetical protein
MHMAAAFDKPCVVIAGGREPPHWEMYPGHQFLHTIGQIDCCRHHGCWKARVQPTGDGDEERDGNLCRYPTSVGGEPVARCMAMIEPIDVCRAIERYQMGAEAWQESSRPRWREGASTWNEDLTLSLCGDAGLICELERGADGAWRGRWTQFERMPIELVPVQDVTLKEAVAHPCNAQLQPLRTVLVFVWFGPYPPIYHLTVRSACQSGVSQILLYGDEPPCLYPNLRWVPQTMGDVTRRVRRVLPEAPEYNDPYKLCDLKPLYYFMFEEDIADFDYWMWQDLDAMCGSFNMVCPFLDGSVHALSHHPRDLGGHWQLFSSDVFRGRSGFWKSRYARAQDRFHDANAIHRMDEAWLHEVLHQEDVEHLHVPSLEKMGAVYYVDGHLIKPGEGEFWTYHFLSRYKRPSYLSVSTEMFESNHLAICDEDSAPFRLMAEDEARTCLSHG